MSYPNRSKISSWLSLAGLGGLVLILVLSGWIVFQFSLPKPVRMLVGSENDYRIGFAPRLFWKDETPFYVLQTENGLIALQAYSKRRQSCLIRWDAERRRFVDPCWGTRMLPDGTYESGPPWEMKPLPVQVKNGEVWVEVGYR